MVFGGGFIKDSTLELLGVAPSTFIFDVVSWCVFLSVKKFSFLQVISITLGTMG